MSKPMLIPYKLLYFRHPHIGWPQYGTITGDPSGQDCITERPNMEPELVRYYRREGKRSVRTWLACGLEVEWRLPDA